MDAIEADNAERFWPKVQITPGCWEWQAGGLPRGYGIFHRRQQDGVLRKILAHRLSYEMHHGPIPTRLIVRHKCDNPPCVNPDHLEVGTHADNLNDAKERGRYWCRHLAGEDHPNAKATAVQVYQLRTAKRGEIKPLAEKFGLRVQTAYAYRCRPWLWEDAR